MKRWLVIPLMLVLSSVSLAAEKMKVGFVRVMDDAQAMVAYEGGYYEKHGLDVELVEFGSGTDLIKAIVGGQLDMGVLGFSNAFTWASRGADLKIVGGAQHGYHSIVVRNDSGIKTVKDLKGHSLASQKEGSTADIVLKGVTLKDAGLSDDDLQIMGVKPAVAVQSLVGGRVDAAFLFEPYDRIAQLVAPVKQIYEIGEVWPFPCMVVITSGKTLEKRKDAIWAAQDAQKEAIELLENKPAEAAKLIADYFIAEPTLKTLEHGDMPREQVIEQAIKTQTFSAVLTDKEVERMRELAEIMVARGIMKPDSLDIDKVLDLSWQKARDLNATVDQPANAQAANHQ
ncbi:ABC transporter substrate-binding protein [Allohahella sp. A8]|uniref:ABC transporter substrate-binding protein n=1 Tax=Allohahella sp. A8 TaxID=3141461 RepID=UPI000C099FA3|nr:ABC transporter substrate-binding protein [Hahellaceae bacterium]|tara:strand:- start:8396 stop:9421 length:1026 start_codon:yes stop_codon:yes gene_type:complete